MVNGGQALAFFPYSFEGEVDIYDWGRMAYTVIYAPEEIIETLPFDMFPRLRISGEVAELPFEGAWQITDGKRYLILPKSFLQASGLSRGDPVEVRFRIADQDAVDVPEALQSALAADDELRRLWDALTPGKKRGMAHHVASAKTETTREKRVAELFDVILSGEPWPKKRR